MVEYTLRDHCEDNHGEELITAHLLGITLLKPAPLGGDQQLVDDESFTPIVKDYIASVERVLK